MPEMIKIADLKAGMVIIQVTQQNGPVKIRKSGLVTSPDMVRGLAEMGVLEVEIDPDQTVELDAPVIEKSQTQKLLERDYSASAKFDNSLSEQFNRSLFLPSVQELPTVWQFYGKHILIVLLVSIGGFGIGWTVSNGDRWLAMLESTPDPVVVNIPVEAKAEAEDLLKAEIINEEQAETQTAVDSDAKENQISESVGAAIEAPVNQVIEEPVLPQEDQSKPSISPDLLRRFESAIASLDQAPEPAYEPEVKMISDVPRVHELPARTLTILPSMAFSAHMYASDPKERWVRVNGRRVNEGDYIEDDLRVITIKPQELILSFNGQEFSMAALTDW
jgi:general secretion pathway protein B